jgi:hypothetical protein
MNPVGGKKMARKMAAKVSLWHFVSSFRISANKMDQDRFSAQVWNNLQLCDVHANNN